MSRLNASRSNFTLIGPFPEILEHEAHADPSPNGSSHVSRVEDAEEPVRADLVHVRTDNRWRRSIVVTEQTALQHADPRCVLLQWPPSPQARSYRLLRHRLLGNSDPHVIAVTSGGPAEGKTTCAINLALAIAEDAMARVLLVEANPLRPSIAEVFGLKSPSSRNAWTPDAVSGSWPIAVANVASTRLDVAASCVGSQGLDRLFFGVAMRDLREAYDYVVIDTPSIRESADANIAAECADGVIVTALATKSHRSALRRSIDQLRPSTIFGVVLLDV